MPDLLRVWVDYADGTYGLYDPAKPEASNYTLASLAAFLGLAGPASDWAGPVFTPGTYLTQAYWEQTVGMLQRIGMWPLLQRWDVRAVKAIPADLWGTSVEYGGTASTSPQAAGGVYVYGARREIHLKDMVGIYTHRDELSINVMHEAVHIRQADLALGLDFARSELMAYTMSEIVAQLLSGDVGVFKQPSPYPTAVSLVAP